MEISSKTFGGNQCFYRYLTAFMHGTKNGAKHKFTRELASHLIKGYVSCALRDLSVRVRRGTKRRSMSKDLGERIMIDAGTMTSGLWWLRNIFSRWLLRNLNYIKSNKKIFIYWPQKKKNTNTKVLPFFFLWIFLFWNRYMIVSISILQTTSLSKF